MRFGLYQIQNHPLRSATGQPVTQDDLSVLRVMLQSALCAHGHDLFLLEGAPSTCSIPIHRPAVPRSRRHDPPRRSDLRRGYQHAAFLRVAVNTVLERTFAGSDLIVCPTLPVPGVPNGPIGYTSDRHRSTASASTRSSAGS
ncbi:hypothetical protein [Dactylosporangium salmoneum]|uniref:hypothetical protein n=1 Tax=Dactylosporangium salmoneum TaxID=53361 RepID=UPI0031E3FC7D